MFDVFSKVILRLSRAFIYAFDILIDSMSFLSVLLLWLSYTSATVILSVPMASLQLFMNFILWFPYIVLSEVGGVRAQRPQPGNRFVLFVRASERAGERAGERARSTAVT